MRKCLFEWFYIIYNIQQQGSMYSQIPAIRLLSEGGHINNGVMVIFGFTSLSALIHCNRWPGAAALIKTFQSFAATVTAGENGFILMCCGQISRRLLAGLKNKDELPHWSADTSGPARFSRMRALVSLPLMKCSNRMHPTPTSTSTSPFCPSHRPKRESRHARSSSCR